VYARRELLPIDGTAGIKPELLSVEYGVDQWVGEKYGVWHGVLKSSVDHDFRAVDEIKSQTSSKDQE